MEEEFNDEQQTELYNKFVELIAEKGDTSSFDKNELEVIYCYAYSENDVYICIEVINCALRKYPDSRKFNDLKVMIQYEYLPLYAVINYADRLSANSFVRRLFEVFSVTSIPEMTSYLTSMLEDVKPGVLDDMQVIFLCKVLINLNLTDYLEKNADMIAERSVNNVVVYASLYKYFINEGNIEKVIKYGKAITDLDPFNDDVWGVVALYQSYNVDTVDQVKDSADYALAINPDNASALLAMHIVCGDKDGDSDYLDRCIASDPELYLAKYYKALSLLENGDSDGASDYLQEYLENTHNVPEEVFIAFLGKVSADTHIWLDARLSERLDNMSCSEIEFWCDSMLNRGMPELAEYISAKAVQGMEEKGDVSLNFGYYRLKYIQYVSLYAQQKYRELVLDFNSNISHGSYYLGAAPLCLMNILCKYESGNIPNVVVEEELRYYLNLFMSSCESLSYSTVSFGNPTALYYMQNLYMHINGNSMPVESYNPCYQFAAGVTPPEDITEKD